MKVAPLLLAGLVGCTASRPQPAATSINIARPGDLNGHAHQLAFYAFESRFRGPSSSEYHLGGGMSASNEPLARVAVGTDVLVHIPRRLGVGHGPFVQVYAANSTPKVSVVGGLSLSTIPRFDQGVLVKCERAGVFELSADAADQDGQALHDTRTIECLVPTRFEASVKGRFIANGGSIYVRCAWFGTRSDGQEVKLMGVFPVAVSPGETSIVLMGPVESFGAKFWPLRATITAPSITSAGFTVTLPIEIIDSNWTLDFTFKEYPNNLWVKVYGLDDKGEKLGLDSCAIKAHTGGVVMDRGTTCQFMMRRNNGIPMKDPREWTADEICVSSVGQTTCKPVPR